MSNCGFHALFDFLFLKVLIEILEIDPSKASGGSRISHRGSVDLVGGRGLPR